MINYLIHYMDWQVAQRREEARQPVFFCAKKNSPESGDWGTIIGDVLHPVGVATYNCAPPT